MRHLYRLTDNLIRTTDDIVLRQIQSTRHSAHHGIPEGQLYRHPDNMVGIKSAPAQRGNTWTAENMN